MHTEFFLPLQSRAAIVLQFPYNNYYNASGNIFQPRAEERAKR